MDTKVQKAWEDFLNPDVVRPRLVRASVYIATFEVLKQDTIVGRLREFYCFGFDESGKDTIDPKYRAKVLNLNPSPVYASLLWLRDIDAINDSDIVAFDRMKSCRNVLAHRLLSLLSAEGLPSDFDDCFQSIIKLIDKIERWWVVNVEIPTNPDFDQLTIDEQRIAPGRMLGLQLLSDVALGDDKQSRRWLDAFQKVTTSAL